MTVGCQPFNLFINLEFFDIALNVVVLLPQFSFRTLFRSLELISRTTQFWTGSSLTRCSAQVIND